MLIENEKLNIEEFKSLAPTLNWLKLPRKLGPNHTEYFYSSKYEDSSTIIKVTIRPSLWMSVSESFKNRMPMDGSIPKPDYKGPVVEWGSYAEMAIDESVLNKIKEWAKPPANVPTQTMTW